MNDYGSPINDCVERVKDKKQEQLWLHCTIDLFFEMLSCYLTFHLFVFKIAVNLTNVRKRMKTFILLRLPEMING
ncbi:hypothetical protein [Halobacillus litoralis]|uniref:hypothetical protein n=1 Tax=Halobacillus litoralis TaxID=45668 RepID=UPI001CFC6351|nr:hypothetical protein [Halobacillus litoralis]